MRLYFIYGLPGVGKLTVARELSGLTGYRLFHIHLLADMLEAVFGFGTQAFADMRDQIWPMIFRRAAEDGLPGLITTFVFERSVRQSLLDEVVDAVTSRGGQVLFVELTCDRAERQRRLVSPPRERYRKITSVELLGELLDRDMFFTPELRGELLRLDTTNLSPAEAARKIAEHSF
ncbi:MAG: AAA family ATPase [Chloroflexi bacterium]|nr:AAA family ATPase [Chloroflexota bacterium]